MDPVRTVPRRCRRATRSSAVAVLLIAAAAAACGDSAVSRSPEAVVRDSAGIRIVEAPLEADVPLVDLTARPPLLRIGALDGDEGEVLYRVIGATLLPDGRLAVGNAGSHQIRFYDLDGTLGASVGGEGDGPGEFQQLSWVGPAGGDSVAAFDGSGQRVTVFGPGGVLARTFRLTGFGDPASASEGEVPPSWPLMEGRLRGGSFVVGAHPIVMAGGDFEGIPDDSLPYHFIGDDGAPVRPPVSVPNSEHWVESTASTASVSPVPFGRRTEAAVGADMLWIGMTDSNDILGYGEDGALRVIIRRDAPPRPVTPDDVERYKEEMFAQVVDNPGFLDFLRENLEKVPFASHHPLFSSLVATDEGGVWIEEYAFGPDGSAGSGSSGDPVVWTAYGPDGTPAGSARLPPDTRILSVAGDTLVLRRQDELSVEYVEVHGLRTTPAAVGREGEGGGERT